MRIDIPNPALALLAALLLAASPPVAAEDRCEIRYAVRLAQDDGAPDTGSTIRTLSACVSSLTYCHTHAEDLAKAHAQETLAEQGLTPDVDSVSIIDIKTKGDCD
jgi:hypothetical protein